MIFLSYAREDSNLAQSIFSVVNRPDRPVFYDKDLLLPGMDWRFELEEKMSTCRLFLSIVSENSVEKEGFVQKELRTAYERAELMPDGKIFIVPIRHGNVHVPRKLSRYQWIDVNDHADVLNLGYCVDMIFSRFVEAGEQASGTTFTNEKQTTVSDAVLRETAVVLLQGENKSGDTIYSYLKVPLWKMIELRRHLQDGSKFNPSSFGEIIVSGTGAPSDEVRAKMKRDYRMVDREPHAGHLTGEAEFRHMAEYVDAYTETMKQLSNHSPEMADVPKKAGFKSVSSAISEGIRDAFKRFDSK